MLLYAVIITIILLLALIGVSAYKLSIYFSSFMFLSKKINYDKANYISNSSFFKYYYNKKFFGFGMQIIFTIILILLSTIAYLGYMSTNHMNYGILSNRYGNSGEFYLVNIFIYVIFAYSFIYGGIYMYWFNYSMTEDSKIEEKEKNLKNLIVENIDYDLLYDYFTQVFHPTQTSQIQASYTLADYIINPKDPKYFENPENVFKYCFTYYILNDITDKRFTHIKKALFDMIKEAGLLEIENPERKKTDNITRIRDTLSKAEDFYIISKYNHNNNIVLKPLETIIDDLITKSNSNVDNKANLEKIKRGIKEYTDDNIKAMINNYDEIQAVFMDTIKAYKEIYDKYYMYYMYSVLITNFLIVYAVIMLVYIVIKIGCSISKDFEDNYNTYYLLKFLNNVGIYILLLYYFITCPIIIFGFN